MFRSESSTSAYCAVMYTANLLFNPALGTLANNPPRYIDSIRCTRTLHLHTLQIPHSQSNCKIEELVLTIGTLTGIQLQRFISQSKPSLKKLLLEEIEGVSNKEFLVFLLSVSPTLRSIQLRNCTFSRDTVDEEYAIDAAMPSLYLEEAKIDGDMCSVLALSRKAPSVPKRAGVGGRDTIFLSIRSTADWEGLIEALRVTGWGAVIIKSGAGRAELLSRAFEEAKSRDIVFQNQLY
jgi:hypothetical protein